MSIDVIFLGLDGVLFDTEALHLAACNAAFAQAEISLRWTLPALRSAARNHGYAHALAAATAGTPLARDRDAVGRLHAAKHQHFLRALTARPPRVSEQCRSLVEDARQAGCKLAVLTDLPSAAASALLEQCYGDDVNSIFTVVGSDQQFGTRGTPGPYLHALHAMGLGASASVVIDATAPALRSAQASGLWTVEGGAFGIDVAGQRFITFAALCELQRSPFALNRQEPEELAA